MTIPWTAMDSAARAVALRVCRVAQDLRQGTGGRSETYPASLGCKLISLAFPQEIRDARYIAKLCQVAPRC